MKASKRAIYVAAGLAVAFYAGRLVLLTAGDWQRINRVRAMSDEGPLSKDVPRLALQTIAEQSVTLNEWGKFFVNAPFEFARYVKAEAM